MTRASSVIVTLSIVLALVLTAIFMMSPVGERSFKGLFVSQEEYSKPQLSSGGVEKDSSNSLSESLEAQIMQTLNAWEENGTEVYFEDNKVYISATDNTNSPVIRLMSKNYNGEINIGFGFDTQEIRPLSAGYNRHTENVSKSYTCDYEFNYTVSPKHFWCYQTVDFGNATPVYTVPVFEHDFESGDLPAKTAYWTQQKEVWDDISGAFDKTTFFLGDVDTWYYKKNFAVTANETYELQLNLQQKRINSDPVKYWVAFWPSDKTIKEALEAETFYALDPWTADLNTDLGGYWKLDNNNLSDSLGLNDATNTGSANTTGIIESGRDHDGGTDRVDYGELQNITSISFWFRVGDTAGGEEDGIMGQVFDATEKRGDWLFLVHTDGAIDFGVYEPSLNYENADVGTVVDDGAYHHIVIVSGTGGLIMYLDGDTATPELTDPTTTKLGEESIENITSGARGSNGFWNYADVDVDEIAVWTDRRLTTGEVTTLYNAGAGITWTDQFNNAPKFTPQLPVNNSNLTSTTLNFNVTVWDDINLLNVSLVLDGAISQSNTSGFNNSFYSFTENGLSVGTHNYSFIAWDNNTVSNQTGTFFMNISVIAPAVTLQAPVDEFNATTGTHNFIAFITSPDTVSNVSLLLNGSIVSTNVSGTNNTNYTIAGTVPDGTHTWTLQACDDDNDCTAAATRNINIDSTAPVIDIVLPATLTNFISVLAGDNQSLNYTLVEANPHTCWYDYNNQNVTFTSCTANSSFTFNVNWGNVTTWVNDTFGNEAFDTQPFFYSYILESRSFDASTTEGVISNFSLGVLSNSTITKASLNYSGTEFLGSIAVSGSNNTITNSITIPAVSGLTNAQFYYNLTDTTGLSYVVSNQTQSVSDFNVDNCSNNTFVLYNFTMVDEATQVKLNASNATLDLSAQLDLDIYDATRANLLQEFNQTFNQTNPFAICLSTPLNGSEVFNIDVQVQYDGVGYAPEFYNIFKEQLTGADIATNITLYDLLDANAQEFQITYKDENFIGVQDALIQVQRKYISEGVFKTVEIPRTDALGETLAHLVLSDVIYNFIVVVNNQVAATFNNVLAVCDNVATGECTINLNSFTGGSPAQGFADVDGYAFRFAFDDSTEEVSVSFVVTSGAASTNVLNVTHFTGTGSQQVCNDLLVSSSGTLTCTVPTGSQNSTIVAQIIQDGQLKGQTIMVLDADAEDIYGSNQVFLALFLFLLLIGLGISDSPVLMGVMLILGTILLFAFNLINGVSLIGAGSALIWFVVAIVLLILKGRRG